MADNKSESCVKRFLAAIDVFSYVPVPQAYPVSTNKSKVGSLLFLCVLIGYLIFDFYQFVVNNIPTLNSYAQSTVNTGYITLPQIAFGLFYYDPIRDDTYMFNNASYFDFYFQITYMNAFAKQNQNDYSTVKIPLVQCKEGSWADQYYTNLTCLDLSPSTIQSLNLSFQIVDNNGSLLLQNPFFKRSQASFMLQRLQIYWCDYSSFQITCVSQQEIQEVLSRSDLYVLIKQPLGYDYRSGKPIQTENVDIFTYQKLQIGYHQQQDNTVDATKFIISPNLLTTFTTKENQYSKIVPGKIVNPNVGTYYTYPLATIRFTASVVMNVIEIHYQTIIDRVSQWSALASLVFMIAALCFLGYNRNKFNKRNPDWERFDQMLKQKLVFEMQPISKANDVKKKNDEVPEDYQNQLQNSEQIARYNKTQNKEIKNSINNQRIIE